MADRRPSDPGATAAKGADTSNSSVWPWVIAALFVAALVIGAVWLVASDSEDDGGTTGDPVSTDIAEDGPADEIDDEVLEEGVEGEGEGLGDVDADDG